MCVPVDTNNQHLRCFPLTTKSGVKRGVNLELAPGYRLDLVGRPLGDDLFPLVDRNSGDPECSGDLRLTAKEVDNRASEHGSLWYCIANVDATGAGRG